MTHCTDAIHAGCQILHRLHVHMWVHRLDQTLLGSGCVVKRDDRLQLSLKMLLARQVQLGVIRLQTLSSTYREHSMARQADEPVT